MQKGMKHFFCMDQHGTSSFVNGSKSKVFITESVDSEWKVISKWRVGIWWFNGLNKWFDGCQECVYWYLKSFNNEMYGLFLLLPVFAIGHYLWVQKTENSPLCDELWVGKVFIWILLFYLNFVIWISLRNVLNQTDINRDGLLYEKKANKRFICFTSYEGLRIKVSKVISPPAINYEHFSERFIHECMSEDHSINLEERKRIKIDCICLR